MPNSVRTGASATPASSTPMPISQKPPRCRRGRSPAAPRIARRSCRRAGSTRRSRSAPTARSAGPPGCRSDAGRVEQHQRRRARAGRAPAATAPGRIRAPWSCAMSLVMDAPRGNRSSAWNQPAIWRQHRRRGRRIPARPPPTATASGRVRTSDIMAPAAMRAREPDNGVQLQGEFGGHGCVPLTVRLRSLRSRRGVSGEWRLGRQRRPIARHEERLASRQAGCGKIRPPCPTFSDGSRCLSCACSPRDRLGAPARSRTI